MTKPPRLTVTAVTLCALLAGCKPQEAQGAAGTVRPSRTSETQTPPRDPLVQAAQTMMNQVNQGRACASLGTKRQRAGEAVESADYAEALKSTPQYQQWAFLAERGLAQRREETVDSSGQRYTTFLPDLTLREDQGQGLYIQSGAQLLYCYGRWTVREAVSTDEFTPTRPDMQALSTRVVLTDAPAWASSTEAAVLNQPNAISEKDGTLKVAVNGFGKPVPAVLNAPNTVWVQVPKG